MCLPSLGTSEPTVGTPDWSRPMGFYPSLQGLPYPYVCYVCLCVSQLAQLALHNPHIWGQLLKTGLFSLFSALLVPFATFH